MNPYQSPLAINERRPRPYCQFFCRICRPAFRAWCDVAAFFALAVFIGLVASLLVWTEYGPAIVNGVK